MHFREYFIVFIFSVIISSSILLYVSVVSHSLQEKNLLEPNSFHHINSTEWVFGSFVINNSQFCQTEKRVELLILVHSSLTHFQFRNIIRKYVLPIKNSKRIFLIGSHNDVGLQRAVQQEYDEFRDVTVASFYDSYRNLTLKHIFGLTWAAKFCPTAELVLKMDDDIFINYNLLDRLIQERYPAPKYDLLATRTGNELIACHVHKKMQVIRNETSRWFVSQQEFAGSVFPDFCSGWAYITTMDVINELLDQIPNHPLFWIDDVYVTGILRESLPHIELVSLNKWFNVDVMYLYNWINDGTKNDGTKYKWRYIFSNTNGDENLLEAALKLNELSFSHRYKCCFPPLNYLQKNSAKNQFTAKQFLGTANRIYI